MPKFIQPAFGCLSNAAAISRSAELSAKLTSLSSITTISLEAAPIARLRAEVPTLSASSIRVQPDSPGARNCPPSSRRCRALRQSRSRRLRSRDCARRCLRYRPVRSECSRILPERGTVRQAHVVVEHYDNLARGGSDRAIARGGAYVIGQFDQSAAG